MILDDDDGIGTPELLCGKDTRRIRQFTILDHNISYYHCSSSVNFSDEINKIQIHVFFNEW